MAPIPAERCSSPAAARWSLPSRWSAAIRRVSWCTASGAGGTVAITDPTVPNGGSVEPGPAHNFPQGGVDLPNIAFGAQTTLAYAEKAVGTGGTFDSERRPPCREHRAPRLLHRRKLRHRRRRPRRHADLGSATDRTEAAAGAPSARLTRSVAPRARSPQPAIKLQHGVEQHLRAGGAFRRRSSIPLRCARGRRRRGRRSSWSARRGRCRRRRGRRRRSMSRAEAEPSRRRVAHARDAVRRER